MNFKLIAKDRPTALERRKRNPRDVVTESIDLQLAVIAAKDEGKVFSIERERYVTITENGRDRRIKSTVQAKPKSWWWLENGVHFLQPRFGTHLIEIQPGMATIECGPTMKDVTAVLVELKAMVISGSLDEQITKAREKAKRG